MECKEYKERILKTHMYKNDMKVCENCGRLPHESTPDKSGEYGELVYKIKDHLTDIDKDFHALEYRLFEQAITAIKTLQAENERLREALESIATINSCAVGSIHKATYEAAIAALKGESDEQD